MNIIYIHGLDSDANSMKGVMLEDYCQQYHSSINVLRPDLNQPPAQVFEYLLNLVSQLKNEAETVIIGSSLGGYFSTLLSNHTGCPALLLNPSTQPHLTLQRFFGDGINKVNVQDKVIYITKGGWKMTGSDLQWFSEHQLQCVEYPKKVAAFIKRGDELLDFKLSERFYQQQGVSVILQEGGDHRFSNFKEQLPLIMSTLQHLSENELDDII